MAPDRRLEELDRYNGWPAGAVGEFRGLSPKALSGCTRGAHETVNRPIKREGGHHLTSGERRDLVIELDTTGSKAFPAACRAGSRGEGCGLTEAVRVEVLLAKTEA